MKVKEKLLHHDVSTQTSFENIKDQYDTTCESETISTSSTIEETSSTNTSSNDTQSNSSSNYTSSSLENTEEKNFKKVKELFDTMKKRRYVSYDDEQYYKKLDGNERKRLKTLEDAIYNSDVNKTPLRFKILNANIDTKLKLLCLQKLDQLDNMSSYSDEYFKLLLWIESVAKLPLGKYKDLPIKGDDGVEKISDFLNDARSKLDKNVYGHHETKEHIIRLLAKWISNKSSKGLVIGLEGPMGTGKTSLCLEICNALNLPSGFVSLGGMSSSDYLVGHSFTYEGSRWGKIAEIMMHAEYSNPVLFFDELDKVSTSRHGEEIVNTLIHITDNTQNHNFRDKYFSEVPIDLSRCIIIFSYNNGDLVNPILKDRMVTIKASGYTQKDKTEIFNKHLLPKMLTEYAFSMDDILFEESIIQYIITLTDEENGVRKLKRSLEDIVSQLNVMRLLKQPLVKTDTEPISFPLKVTDSIAKKLVSKKQNDNSKLHMMYI
jgi:ATP-dependent Lon protease